MKVGLVIWFQDWVFDMQFRGLVSRGTLEPYLNVALEKFQGRFSSRYACHLYPVRY